ncbi:PREDICTED: putative F-box/kelch-repeat protein At2g29780 [Camelina sativa]|uniref:F-box/kelch-repeat protein At2g29780 n=1 Tax=Camelina sativa TaxID=90675 RepID=A0ABM0TDS8_CAMSA|nr:PREDICTED: putative F-box/kelch-repeat protein At2g29780 [Camelina sativa]
MALISETFDNGSNGGDPNKKPEELHKNPQEEEENKNDKPIKEEEEEVENLLPVFTRYIPEDIAESILLLVPRCHYPKLSLFCRSFHNVISSPGLYQRRLQLGLTEPVLYALIRFPLASFNPSWFILNHDVPRNISLRLSEISSAPPMSPMKPESAVVTIGYNMYVIGGCDEPDQPTSNVFVIDCRFHRCSSLPGMQRARRSAAAGVIDKKIYVIGGCEQIDDNWIEVFDVETGIWSSVAGPYEYNSSMVGGGFMTSVVMQEKIYMLDPECCLTYEPRQGTWQSWGFGSELKRSWHQSSCVVEDFLCSINSCIASIYLYLSVYDPNDMFWRGLALNNGVSGLPSLNYNGCKLANVSGKLVILNNTGNDVWCIEIALERSTRTTWDGHIEIDGRVVSRSQVLTSMNSPFVDLAHFVTF